MIRIPLTTLPIYTRLNSVLAQSLPPSLSTIGSLSRYWRSGGPIIYQKYASESPTCEDSVIINNPSGDITCLDLDGTSSLVIRPSALHAFSSSLDVTSPPPASSNLFSVLRVTGQGVIVMGGNGATERVELSEAEEMHVDPAYLVAYDSCLNPTPPVVVKLGVPGLYPASEKKIGAFLTVEGQKERLGFVGRWIRDAIKAGSVNSWRSVKRWSVGSKQLYKIQGPGVAYLSSKRI